MKSWGLAIFTYLIAKVAWVAIGMAISATATGGDLQPVQNSLMSAHSGDIVQQVFAGKSINLPIPAGYCAMPNDTPRGKAFYESQNKLKAGMYIVALVFAKCEELPMREANPPYQRIRNMGSYLFYLSDGNQALIWKTRKAFLDQVAARAKVRGGTLMDDAELQAALNANLNKPGTEMKDDNEAFAGVDGNAAFFATITTVSYPNGSETNAGFTALTLVNGIPVGVNLYDELADSDTLKRLRSAQEQNMSRLMQIN